MFNETFWEMWNYANVPRLEIVWTLWKNVFELYENDFMEELILISGV